MDVPNNTVLKRSSHKFQLWFSALLLHPRGYTLPFSAAGFVYCSFVSSGCYFEEPFSRFPWAHITLKQNLVRSPSLVFFPFKSNAALAVGSVWAPWKSLRRAWEGTSRVGTIMAAPLGRDTLPDYWSYGVCRDGRVFFIKWARFCNSTLFNDAL